MSYECEACLQYVHMLHNYGGRSICYTCYSNALLRGICECGCIRVWSEYDSCNICPQCF
jgi:hypothetical protein